MAPGRRHAGGRLSLYPEAASNQRGATGDGRIDKLFGTSKPQKLALVRTRNMVGVSARTRASRFNRQEGKACANPRPRRKHLARTQSPHKGHGCSLFHAQDFASKPKRRDSRLRLHEKGCKSDEVPGLDKWRDEFVEYRRDPSSDKVAVDGRFQIACFRAPDPATDRSQQSCSKANARVPPISSVAKLKG